MSLEDFDFLSGDADASWTRLSKASGIRKGGYAVLRGFPCKIVEVSTAQPGKHGHSKIHFIGLDIFTGKKYEDISPSKDTIEVNYYYNYYRVPLSVDTVVRTVLI